ncbi:hypothetical protein J1N35_021755 [Gossypium stocksii]|uniref:Aminotransferase-like plant mobile domain-containing protein n=1 Tax=Gossypium stocksii TaxID=47602 RepID=A0A9D3VHC1_9ROSI|nr:hypothetical protein J1N35_021755 [Gossypium stocksii]
MSRLIKKDPHISDALLGASWIRVSSIDPDIQLAVRFNIYTSGALAPEDPHFSFSVWGVHSHSRGCCTATWAPNRWESRNGRELMCAARAYIMHIIGGVLILDANNSKVHIQCLPLLADLSNVRSYSWGSTVLAVLYRELCRTKKLAAVDISGCLTLLQSWALYWMPFLASPYLLSGQSTVIPPHMQRPGAYESVANIEAEPEEDSDLEPEL